MNQKEYRKVKIGSQVEIIGHAKRIGDKAVVVKMVDSRFGSPMQICFSDGQERWITHRNLKLLKGD